MKILNKILILAAVAVSAVSCDLTLLPEDEVTPKQYFATESDLALWSNKFYNYLLETADVGINDADDKIDNGLSNFIAGSRNPASESWSFSQLREINYLLEHLDQCTDRGVALKYEAVARFFRAYFYFVKVRAYGDVPYYDHVLASNDPDLFRARDDRGYVMDKVLEDFDFAAKNLPSSWGTKSTRVTKWAALAYASRAALFEGTFRRYHSATLFKNDDKNAEKAEKYLRIAADCAAEFIASAPYSLYNTGDEPYRDLFWADDAKTTEVVLCRRYDAGAGVTHSVPQSINFGRTSLTRGFINHYLMADGSRFTDKKDYDKMFYTEVAKNRDPRMAQTVLCPGYKMVGASTVTKSKLYSHTGYEPIKFLSTAAKANPGAGTSDWICMRAAEVYLNYAEALAELGTLTQNDLDISVNRIRKRAGMPDLKMADANANPDPYLVDYYKNVTKSANTGVILEIRRERTVELVMEPPYRSWDLFRWKEAKLALNTVRPWEGVYIPGDGTYDMDGDGKDDLEIYSDTPKSTCETKLKIGSDIIVNKNGYIEGYSENKYGTNWDDERDYLWPIPASQRVLNHNLTQNPGYQDGLSF